MGAGTHKHTILGVLYKSYGQEAFCFWLLSLAVTETHGEGPCVVFLLSLGMFAGQRPALFGRALWVATESLTLQALTSQHV